MCVLIVPSFGDMEELTEITAFVQESYRWRPVSIGGFPHRATRDIVYGGYVIPAGATVIGNHWYGFSPNSNRVGSW